MQWGKPTYHCPHQSQEWSSFTCGWDIRVDPVIDRPGLVACSDGLWHPDGMDATLVVGQQGRLVIPADVRHALGLAAGDRLHLRLVGKSVVLERPQDAAAELRGLASRVPKNRSLVDELLEERRLAAASGE